MLLIVTLVPLSWMELSPKVVPSGVNLGTVLILPVPPIVPSEPCLGNIDI